MHNSKKGTARASCRRGSSLTFGELLCILSPQYAVKRGHSESGFRLWHHRCRGRRGVPKIIMHVYWRLEMPCFSLRRSNRRFERDSALREKKVALRFTVDVVQFANLEPIEWDLLFKVSY
jgi:hypothetical protein